MLGVGAMVGLALVLVVLGSSPAGAETVRTEAGKIKLATLDLAARGDVGKALTETIGALISTQLDRTGVFQVITQDDVRQMIGFDQLKTALTCEDEASCLAEIGGALGVPFLLTGSIAKLESSYVLNLVLIDIDHMLTVKRETVAVESVSALMKNLAVSVERVVASVLYAATGKLEVTVREEGATVKLDDAILGTTPLAAQDIPAGPHTVAVSKDGFIQFSQDVTVKPGQVTRLDARLIPSPEFIAAYQRRAGRDRLVAWLTSAGALAIGASAIGIAAWNDGRARNFGGSRAEKDSIALWDGIAIGAVVAAGLSLGVSLFFWITGDPPDHYERLAPGPGTSGVD